MYLPPTRPQLWISPNDIDFLTHPYGMKRSFMSFMAMVTKRVINDCPLHRVHFCWHSITTSTPHQILNFVWHMKRPNAIPKFWIHMCGLLGRLQLSFRLQKSISRFTCVPSIMRVGPCQYVLYSNLSQRYFFDHGNFITRKDSINQFFIPLPCSFIDQLCHRWVLHWFNRMGQHLGRVFPWELEVLPYFYLFPHFQLSI